MFTVSTSLGTVAVAMASHEARPARMIPECSASVPTMNPDTSCTNRSGIRLGRVGVSMK